MGVKTGAIAALALLALTGCASVITERIEVPVPVPCNPPEPPRPELPVDALPEDADVFEVSRGLWATVEVLEGHAEELRAALAGCR